MPFFSKKPGRRIAYFFIVCLLVVAGFLLPPLFHLWQVKDQQYAAKNAPQTHVNDVSQLNGTLVDTAVSVSGNYQQAKQELVQLLHYADSAHLSISIAGARHSMGGHTISPNGIWVNMLPFHELQYDTTTGILTAGAGALWSDVIPFLDKYGRSVGVMQSDNAFSVGGSVSVNCHGWQHNTAPIASTIVSFDLLNAKGELLTCSRKENRELFSLALGGYGLFGIITRVRLSTVANQMYSFHSIHMSSEKYIEHYGKHIDGNPQVRMVYGRLNVNQDHFLEEAMLNFFLADTSLPLAGLTANSSFASLKRRIFLGSKNDDYGKKLRWNAERTVGKLQRNELFSRNQIMNESPELYLNRDSARTDILHEYFIPREQVSAFIRRLQQIIPRHSCDLLNVTLRNVYPDKDTYLNYARSEMFGFVMFFNQPRTTEADGHMQALTSELIDACLSLKGTYYLPYRLHASSGQFRNSYPMADSFFLKKRKYDPKEVFQNAFYTKYKK